METVNLLTSSFLPEDLAPLLPQECHVIEVCLSDAELGEGSPGVSTITEKQPVRAEFLYWLATSPEMRKHIRPGGIRVENARIDGKLNFQNTEVPHVLQFHSCEIPELANFSGARLQSLSMINCQVDTITADFMDVQSAVLLTNGFQAAGKVRMVGATLGGSLQCTGGSFNRKGAGEAALDLSLLKTNGSVFLNGGFRANGKVSLWSADIRGGIDCEQGTISLQLDDPNDKKDVAFLLEGAKIGNSAALRDMRVEGKIRLNSANIEGNLELGGTKIINPGATALEADGIYVRRAIHMWYGFEATGLVQMLSAVVGDLVCTGGKFHNPGYVALAASKISVQYSILLRNGFEADGEVELHTATVGSYLDLQGGKFHNPNDIALDMAGISVQGAVWMGNGFEAEGEVRMHNASVGADVDCSGGKFLNQDGVCFNLDRSTVGGNFFWRGMGEYQPKGKVSLINAEVANFIDDRKSWPRAGQLGIDGFVYGSIGCDVCPDEEQVSWDSPNKEKTEVELRIEWINRQYAPASKENSRKKAIKSTQPYKQLAKVFKQEGREDEAREILIEYQRAVADNSGIPLRQWKHTIGWMTGYGYKSWRVIFMFILPLIVIGAFVYQAADRLGAMQPTQTPIVLKDGGQPLPYPRLNPLVYSADVLLPIVDLHQENYWEPNEEGPYGSLFVGFMWFQIIAGWFFTTVGAASVTGLIRDV